MSSPVTSKATARSVFRRFRRNRRGSAVVEFALVAPMFFALLFAIIETALMFFATQALETITETSARIVSTGQAQGASYDATAFKTNAVCPQIAALFACENIYVDVKSYNAFTSVTIDNEIDATNASTSGNLKYCPGNAGDIVVVRLFYQWPLFVTRLGYNISNLAGNQRLLVATAAFRNEPFVAPVSAC
jgi:Flp pilus assembly protein TadG